MKNKLKTIRAFTIAELLIVVAIISVLVAVSIPIFTTQLEKSRNATDLANARAMGAALSVYYMSNDTAYQELVRLCNVSGSAHCLELTVRPDKLSCNDNLAPALISAGLIRGPISSSHTYSTPFCKSKEKWISYSIAVTAYQNDNQIRIAYRGRPKGDNLGGHSWEWYATISDTTGFRDIMKGNGS